MEKKKLLDDIQVALQKPAEGRNSMGCSESFYNPYYLVGSAFKEAELKLMSDKELSNLLKLAKFASEVFY